MPGFAETSEKHGGLFLRAFQAAAQSGFISGHLLRLLVGHLPVLLDQREVGTWVEGPDLANQGSQAPDSCWQGSSDH